VPVFPGCQPSLSTSGNLARHTIRREKCGVCVYAHYPQKNHSRYTIRISAAYWRGQDLHLLADICRGDPL